MTEFITSSFMILITSEQMVKKTLLILWWFTYPDWKQYYFFKQ